MRRWLESLRGRLVTAMLLVFSLGLGGALALDPVEHGAIFGWYGTDLIGEPYQDFTVLLPFAVGGIALIWLVSGWSLRHLASASREAAVVGPANPGGRISTKGLPREVRPLVDAVNGALDRLAQAYEAEQRFVADAAHEIRTPLAVLSLRLQRARLDGLLDWPAIDRDMEQVNRLVSQLLDLARKEHVSQKSVANGSSVVNLSRVAREAAAAVILLVEETGRTLEVMLPPSLPVRGRAADLRDMLRNLLDNALVHGQGTIRLAGRIATDQEGNQQAWITISDEGVGVPVELGEKMFDRFRKNRPNSPGHGLGLAIVREIVRGHGGVVGFMPGPTCRVQFVLPAVEAPVTSSRAIQYRKVGRMARKADAQGSRRALARRPPNESANLADRSVSLPHGPAA